MKGEAAVSSSPVQGLRLTCLIFLVSLVRNWYDPFHWTKASQSGNQMAED